MLRHDWGTSSFEGNSLASTGSGLRRPGGLGLMNSGELAINDAKGLSSSLLWSSSNHKVGRVALDMADLAVAGGITWCTWRTLACQACQGHSMGMALRNAKAFLWLLGPKACRTTSLKTAKHWRTFSLDVKNFERKISSNTLIRQNHGIQWLNHSNWYHVYVPYSIVQSSPF